MKSTLIIYGTRKGTTEITAQVLAETLILKHKHKVEIVNIRQVRKIRQGLAKYDNFIIGSSIINGRWKSGVMRLLRKKKLRDKRVALFVTAGITLNKAQKSGLTKEAARNEAIHNYIDRYMNIFHFVPVSKTAFGGLVLHARREKFNSWRREDIESWAISLGKYFK